MEIIIRILIQPVGIVECNKGFERHVYLLRFKFIESWQGNVNSLSQWTLKKKSLNFIFPIKYVIPKSLKFSHWLSKLIILNDNDNNQHMIKIGGLGPGGLFLGLPYQSHCYSGVPRFESQTTGPQTTNLP